VELASGIAGAYCGKQFADLGAQVIKLEPPTGDPIRSQGPYPGGKADPDASGLFMHLNTGKASVVVDSASTQGREELIRHCENASLVVDDGVLERLGVDYDELRAKNPRVVLVEISGFGAGGPYSSYRMNDYVAYAVSGWMAAMGDPGQPPVYPGKDYPFYVAGLYAVFGANAALLHASRTGVGQRVDVAVLDACLSIEFYEPTTYSFGGDLRRRAGNRIHGVAASLQPCGDGWVSLTVSQNRDWKAFVDLLGAPELAEGDFATPGARMENADDLESRLRRHLSGWRAADLVEECQRHKVAVAVVATTKDILDSAQLRARGWFETVEYPSVGLIEQAGPPFRLARQPWRLARAPRLGENTDEFTSAVARR
jgi:crotonobetainyl-CoA:carnitine CoA-transferase CaiB-like acyl-CoA transferase